MEFLQTNWVWLLLVAGALWLVSRGGIGCAWGAMTPTPARVTHIVGASRVSPDNAIECHTRARLARPSTGDTAAIVAAEGAGT